MGTRRLKIFGKTYTKLSFFLFFQKTHFQARFDFLINIHHPHRWLRQQKQAVSSRSRNGIAEAAAAAYSNPVLLISVNELVTNLRSSSSSFFENTKKRLQHIMLITRGTQVEPRWAGTFFLVAKRQLSWRRMNELKTIRWQTLTAHP